MSNQAYRRYCQDQLGTYHRRRAGGLSESKIEQNRHKSASRASHSPWLVYGDRQDFETPYERVFCYEQQDKPLWLAKAGTARQLHEGHALKLILAAKTLEAMMSS